MNGVGITGGIPRNYRILFSMASPPATDPDRPSAKAPPWHARHPRFRVLAERASDRLHGRHRLHLIHIGKTGGTALKHALQPHRRTAAFRIILHDHQVALREVPRGELFVFVVRDPISRFASAFRSRQRKGRPRYYTPWSEEESGAFARFQSPNELALALAAGDAKRRAGAEAAMRAIRHVRASYWDWFESEAALRARLPDLFFIGFQETLTDDFAAIRAKLGLPATVILPADDLTAHRTPPDVDVHLYEKAQRILRRWYERDYEFLRLCREIAPPRSGA